MAKVRELKLYTLETTNYLAVVEAHTKAEAIEKSDFTKSQVIVREATEEDINYLKAMGGYIVR